MQESKTATLQITIMKRTIAFVFLAVIFLECVENGWARKLATDVAVDAISEEVSRQLPEKSRVLVADLVDLDGHTPYLGRYLADKLQISLIGRKLPISIVDRSKLALSLEEFQLQRSGLIDEATVVKMGKMFGATVLVYGTLTDLEDSIDITLKVQNIETGVAIGGAAQKVTKDASVASLVRTIIQSEREKEEALKKHQQAVLDEIEADRQQRMAAIDREASEKRAKLKDLDEEIRAKSVDLQLYEAKRAEIARLQSRIDEIHNAIEQTNQDVVGKLKIGMTEAEIMEVLGRRRVRKASNDCLVAGRYFLITDGTTLTKAVRNESRLGYSVDNCLGAQAYGQNIIGY